VFVIEDYTPVGTYHLLSFSIHCELFIIVFITELVELRSVQRHTNYEPIVELCFSPISKFGNVIRPAQPMTMLLPGCRMKQRKNSLNNNRYMLIIFSAGQQLTRCELKLSPNFFVTCIGQLQKNSSVNNNYNDDDYHDNQIYISLFAEHKTASFMAGY